MLKKDIANMYPARQNAGRSHGRDVRSAVARGSVIFRALSPGEELYITWLFAYEGDGAIYDLSFQSHLAIGIAAY